MKVATLCVLVGVFTVGCKDGSAPTTDTSDEPAEELPEHLLYVYTTPAVGEERDAFGQLVAGGRRWEPGRTLRVCLFQGNPVVSTLIREVASEWSNYSSVKLDFGPAPRGYNCLSPQGGFHEIRVGFRSKGYWSYLGTDSETRLDPLQPSMNLEQFNLTYSEGRFTPQNVRGSAKPRHRAVILHEFGHALGLLHEHQNPALACDQQLITEGENNVYDYFAGRPNYWSRDQVDRNLGYIALADPDYISGEPDPESIMMYSLPPQIFKKAGDGSPSPCAVPENLEISAKDKQIVAMIYPATPTDSATAMDAGLPDAAAAISSFAPAFQEEDQLARVLVDLESNDTITRRNARRRLAAVLRNPESGEAASGLIEKMADPSASYRFRLGVSAALANAPEIKLSESESQVITNLARDVRDATLKASLEAARDATHTNR